MEVIIGFMSAIIAAVVSLIGVIISVYTNRKTLKVEIDKLERELQRKLTEKLYDQRLETYPEAIAITDGLRPSRLLPHQGQLTEEYFQQIISRLDQWQNTKAGFLLSDTALLKLNNLRTILRESPQDHKKYTLEQLENFQMARKEFRTALRKDIHLLYKEEVDQ